MATLGVTDVGAIGALLDLLLPLAATRDTAARHVRPHLIYIYIIKKLKNRYIYRIYPSRLYVKSAYTGSIRRVKVAQPPIISWKVVGVTDVGAIGALLDLLLPLAATPDTAARHVSPNYSLLHAHILCLV